MAEFAGSATVIQWVHAGGTLTMSAETRSLNITPSMETIDATAGQDTSKVFLSSFAEWTVDWEGVAQENTTAATSGTAYTNALAVGKLGTLNIGPFGTAGSAVKYTMPGLCLGLTVNSPYADVVTVSTSWKTSSGGSMNVTTW